MAGKLTITFVNVILAAREEARRINQSYLGVEHIFMALCRLGSFTEKLLRRQGLDPRALRHSVRQMVSHRFITKPGSGIHFTPRLRTILDSINKDAAEGMTADIPEPELLKAIIKEGDSIPMRLLRDSGVDLGEVLARHEAAVMEEMAVPSVHVEEEALDAKEGYKQLLLYGRDLTQMASEGLIKPVIGREEEVRHLEQTLVRATKSNPVLLGEAGVGKTAIVEGLAYLIAHDQVIPELRGKHIIDISLAQVIAGTKYRGAFEENLMKIIKAACAIPEIILAIDELHTLVGSGGPKGGLDAANILKPALARGEIRLIGATTKEEYRKYIETDAALDRRFQRITIEEPTPAATRAILAGIRERFEHHHHVVIEDSALQAAVELSVRFLLDRHLPDKAIDLLDEACAHVRVCAPLPSEDQPVISDIKVSASEVATVLTEWTGLPVADLSSEQQQRLADMPTMLSARVIGQTQAIQVVTRSMEAALTGLRSGNRPMAVLLFVGPTGVGKTELAKALAEFLFGSEQEMIRLDMSEYQERHQVAKLIGAPPGYIGHEEAGQLTDSLRNKPYSVVLLDEVEKAHPDVFDVFLQLFDDGRLTDAHGKTADGTNAIFIMTSNLGSRLYDTDHDIGFSTTHSSDINSEEIVSECKKFFRPEFFNRIDEVVVFESLTKPQLEQIVQKLVAELSAELAKKNISISLTPEAMSFQAAAGYEPMYGARPLRRSFERLLVQPLAHKTVQGEFVSGDRIAVTVEEGRFVIRKELTP